MKVDHSITIGQLMPHDKNNKKIKAGDFIRFVDGRIERVMNLSKNRILTDKGEYLSDCQMFLVEIIEK